MKVTITCLAQDAYACIKTETISLDVKLDHGRGASKSLADSASEMRRKAARLIRNAALIEQASTILGDGE